MNWEALGAFGEILGAIAVVASLFYVGRQIKESTRATQGQTFLTLIVSLSDVARVLVNDAEVSEIIRKTLNNEELSDDEYLRYNAQLLIALRHAEAAHFQYLLGLVKLEQLVSLTSALTIHLSDKFGRRVWEQVRDERPEAFRDFIEREYVSDA